MKRIAFCTPIKNLPLGLKVVLPCDLELYLLNKKQQLPAMTAKDIKACQDELHPPTKSQDSVSTFKSV